jgi:putative ABC transport system permease protein
MIFWEIITSALRSLTANRLRSLLTMLGVVIGVGAVVAMISLGEGAQASVTASIQSMGANLRTVRPGPPQRGPVRAGNVETLTAEDAEAIALIPGVIGIAPEVSGRTQIKYLERNANVSVIGTVADYLAVRNFRMAEGQFFSASDVAGRRRVVILGAQIAETLFGDEPAVDERVQIKGLGFTVAGVFEAKGDAGWSNPDENVVVPLTTAQSVLFGMRHVSSIGVQAEDVAIMPSLQAEMEGVLLERHRIGPGAEPDFNIRSQSELMDQMNEMTQTFTNLLGGVAAVSLLVGGIGIMNIMLVSVRERTREIGIRKAVGAKRSDILIQFLVEAVIVSVMGGLLGIALGYALSALIASISGWATIIPIYAIVLAVGTSATIGIVFGVWPAREAARLDPVEALRYE